MPSFLNEDIRNDLFSGKDSSSLCIKNLRTGLDVLGVVKVKIKAALTSLKDGGGGNSLSIYFFICGCKKKMFSVRKSTGEGEQALVPPLP